MVKWNHSYSNALEFVDRKILHRLMKARDFYWIFKFPALLFLQNRWLKAREISKPCKKHAQDQGPNRALFRLKAHYHYPFQHNLLHDE